MLENYLRVNPQNIAAETFDSEVVIVHFVNGNYYALNDLAAEIWHWLVDGHRVTSILHHIEAARPGVDIKAVRDFVGRLLEENLLEPCEPSTASDRPLPSVAADREISPPRLEKYEDMQKLIQLDPIHEVDDTGWPHTA